MLQPDQLVTDRRRRSAVHASRGVAVALAALVAALGTALPAQASAATGEIFVVHGVPGLAVDVLVDGEDSGRDAGAGQVVGPIEVAAGSHDVALSGSGGEELAGTVEVEAGGSVDVVAHLPADPGGDPLLTAYPNDLSAVGPDKARLAVAHTAQVPPADVRVDGEPLLRNVANAEVLTVEVPAQTYSVDIVATGTDGPAVFGPVDLPVAAGTLTRVFAFGSPDEDTMDAVVHELPVAEQGSEAPGRVETGTGGQVAAASAGPSVPYAAAGVALLALLALAGSLVTSRALAARRTPPSAG